MKEILVLGIDGKKVYRISSIKISKRGDIYHISMIKVTDMHFSRHRDGTTQWRARKQNFKYPLPKRIDIRKLKDIEFLPTSSFGLDSLPILFTRYGLKKTQGLVAIDLREFKSLNMTVAIFRDAGIPKLLDNWKNFRKREIHIFDDFDPKVAVIVIDAKTQI